MTDVIKNHPIVASLGAIGVVIFSLVMLLLSSDEFMGQIGCDPTDENDYK